jgi:hypothetical protein
MPNRNAWPALTRAEQALSVADKISKADGLLDAIENDMSIAVALAEVSHPALYDAGIVNRFENTYAAHAFDLIRNHVTLSVVMTLTRIWDIDKDSRSIPNVVKFLAQPDILDELIARRRVKAMTLKEATPLSKQVEADPGLEPTVARWAEEDADQAERYLREAVPDVLSQTNGFLTSGLKTSIDALRNRSIAHNAELARIERAATTPIDPVMIGDEVKALKQTVAILTDLFLIFRQHHINLHFVEDIWRQFSADFWNRISAEPKGKPASMPPSGDETE